MTSVQGFSRSGSTSSGLLRRVQSLDAVAWNDLVTLYGPLVYHWTRQAGLQPADAADVMQDVFRSVLTGIDRFDSEGAGSFRGWLRTIARSRLIDWQRRTARQTPALGGSTAQAVLGNVPDGDLPDEDPPLTDPQSRLFEALEQLRESVADRTWQAFWRTTFESQPAAEVAAALGMTTLAVYEAKSRTLRKLREMLSPE